MWDKNNKNVIVRKVIVIEDEEIEVKDENLYLNSDPVFLSPWM